MAETKHVGRLKANQRRVVVAYRVIPGEETPTNSLVIDTASLTDADHDTLIKTVEGPAGQEAFEFAEVMARTTLSDGSNMLANFHSTGKLTKVPMDQVEMLPNPNYTIGLDELNKVIAEQRGTDIAGLAMKDPNELPEGSTLTEAGTVNEMPATTKVQAEAQAANIQAPNNAAITDEQLAASYRSQADSMFKEAKRLREQAEELVPTKKSKASAKTAS
jgi:hypothetical protein|tara:strand:+ start:19033 stop:19686 length:654 start_codon:yes stop_codon:yes gene_type:complete